jgi:hypothetical protein
VRPVGVAVDEVHGVPLADFVAGLRAELRAAQDDADPDLPIDVDQVTVEFTVLTKREGEGKAGLRFWVVEAGVTGKVAAESTQKVTLQLKPLDPSGTRPARIRDVEQRSEDEQDDNGPAARHRRTRRDID